MKKLQKIYFSPTRTTLKILNAISINLKFSSLREYNIKPDNSYHNVEIPEDSVTIIGVPVYSGRVPAFIIEEFEKFTAKGSPVVLVVVYGNRDYEDSLLELKDIATKRGFNVIAAASFVAEHSFSTSENPLAQNRPDVDDFMKCKEFAKTITKKLEKGVETIEVPGNYPYKERSVMPPIAPKVDKEKCNDCGDCVDVCPTGAIASDGTTDATKCIWCCACVKSCTTGARTFDEPVIISIKDKLKGLCKKRREPEFFV